MLLCPNVKKSSFWKTTYTVSCSPVFGKLSLPGEHRAGVIPFLHRMVWEHTSSGFPAPHREDIPLFWAAFWQKPAQIWCFPFPCALGQTTKVSLNVSFLSPSFVFNLHVTVRNLFATVCTEATVQHQYRQSVHLGLQGPLHSGGSSMSRNGSDRPLARAPGCVSLRSNLLLLPDLPISYTGASSPLKSLSWQKGGWLWAPLLAANTTL